MKAFVSIFKLEMGDKICMSQNICCCDTDVLESCFLYFRYSLYIFILISLAVINRNSQTPDINISTLTHFPLATDAHKLYLHCLKNANNNQYDKYDSADKDY